MKVCISVLLLLGSIFAIAAAGPISEDSMKDMINEVLSQELSEAKYATYAKCLTRVHTIKIDFGGYEYIYNYRMCKEGAYWCYDARENLPKPCPVGFYSENCYEIEWKVRGQTYEHSICEDFGPPCQAPITYTRYGKQYTLQKSNSRGVCYPPKPIYNGEQISVQKQEEALAKAANSVSLCEEDEGCKEVPTVTVITQDQTSDDDDVDCFCIKHGKRGRKICAGKCTN